MSEAEESSVQAAAADEPSVFRQMYRITADREATFEEKTRRLIDLGRAFLDLPYGFLTRIKRQEGGNREQSATEAHEGERPDRSGGVQKVLYASGEHPLLQAGETCPLSEAYCRKTIHRQELLSIQNAPAEGWQSDAAFERFELGSYIGSRIVVEGELYGTFCFASPEARDRLFSEDEEALVELLTRWASYELERQRSRERIEQFAELVTHDLRNPLNAAQMNLYVVRRHLDRLAPPEDDEGQADSEGQEGPQDEDGREAKIRQHFDATERALERMEAIIADTLALAHGEQRLGPDDLEPLSLKSIAETCWEQAASGEATLEVAAARSADDTGVQDRRVLAHEGRLRQLLENLFRNAIDHVGPSVTVTVGRTEDGFFVADDGPGIPPEKREKIFETSYSTREGGTGLGLSIAWAVAMAHGWSLSVTESAGGGARFEVTGVRTPDT